MKRGFSLFETTLYIALVNIFIIASLSLLWVVVKNQLKQESLSEINTNIDFVLNKITSLGAKAATIDPATTYTANPSKLVLTFSSSPQITIDTYDKAVTFGPKTITVKKLRYQEGTSSALDLTTDDVNIINFTLFNFSTSQAASVKILLTLSRINPGSDAIYEYPTTSTTTFTLRQK